MLFKNQLNAFKFMKIIYYLLPFVTISYFLKKNSKLINFALPEFNDLFE